MRTVHQFLFLHSDPAVMDCVKTSLEADYIACEMTWVRGREAFQNALAGGWAFDLLFAEFEHLDLPGLEALALARRAVPDAPFILLTPGADEAATLAGFRAGACDTLALSSPDLLGFGVRRALKEARQTRALQEAQTRTHRITGLLRAVLESSAEGILVLDLAGKVTAYNRRFLSLCGVPDHVLATLRLDQILAFMLDQFEDPEAFLDEARLLGTQSPRETPAALMGRGGRALEALERIPTVDGQADGKVLSFREVSHRDQGSEGVKLLLATQQNLLKATHAGRVVPWCLLGDTLVLSDFAEDLLGAFPEGLPKELPDLVALFHPEDENAFLEALEHPQDASFDARMRSATGDWIWTQWHLERIPGGGFHGIFIETTQEHRRTDQRLDQCKRETMNTIIQGTAGVYRERIQMFQSRLALLSDSRPLTEAQRRHIEALNRLVEHSQAFMTRLSPPTDGMLPPPTPTQLNEVIEGLWPRAEAALPRGIHLQMELEENLPPLPLVPTQMEQLLMNLLLNAREALQESGRIQIRTQLGKDGPAGEQERTVRLEVQDDGPGVQPEVEDWIFDPFFTTRTDEHTHGLGLWMCRCIMEALGGTIVHVHNGQPGACFRLEWPLPLSTGD